MYVIIQNETMFGVPITLYWQIWDKLGNTGRVRSLSHCLKQDIVLSEPTKEER